MRGDDAATGAVDALAVLAHPLAQGVQALHSLDGETTIGTRPHVDEQVAIASCSTNEGTDNLIATLVIFVGDAISPGVIHGHTRLQR